MQPAKSRFSFWRVFWVIAGLYVLSGIIGLIVLATMPVETAPVALPDLLRWTHLVKLGLNILFSAAFFYVSLNIFYKLLSTRKPAFQFIRVSLLCMAACFVFTPAMKAAIPEHTKMTSVETPGLLLFSYIVSSILYTGVSLLLAYLTLLRDDRKQRKVLEEQKLQWEVEKTQANYNFLKAQINPHFLYNTLNFLYARSLPYDPELSEGILTLSDIMRYALSADKSADGRTLLKDEIEHVRNVIKINQLRFSNNLKVQFEVEGHMNGETIIPFLLITIVENAFKHGDLKSSDAPVQFHLRVKDNRLEFFSRNRKKAGPKEMSTGIGLNNIKKQLELVYGTGFKLAVKEDETFYTTELTINRL
jgi:two-component system LytT family sensor kinase